MIKQSRVKDIDPKLLAPNDPKAAKHFLEIERKGKHQELEDKIDTTLTPKQKTEKYTQQFYFDTEDYYTRIQALITELEQIQDPVFIAKGFNNSLLVQTESNVSIHDEFNRIELAQVMEILAWMYQI